MNSNSTEISELNRYRLGRMFLDGANAAWIANRLQLDEPDVQAAWEFCRRRLSEHFAAGAGDEMVLLGDDQLHERAEDCLRLLLHWHEALLDQQRARSFSDQTDAE